MKTTIIIEGPGYDALSRMLRDLARQVEYANHCDTFREALQGSKHTIATYHRPTTATVHIDA